MSLSHDVNAPVAIHRAAGETDGDPRGNQSPNATKTVAGWSSPVARQAHNLKAAGSNPAPATKKHKYIKTLQAALRAAFCV